MAATHIRIASLFLILGSTVMADNSTESSSDLHPELRTYLFERVAEFDEIPDDRKRELKKLSQYVNRRLADGQPVRLTFICTHNSRRSHISQIWAAVAAHLYGVDGVSTFSGGTEATAFNPRAVAALKRSGLKIESQNEAENPPYAVSFSDAAAPLFCFSKVYNESPNPVTDFCAVMTCSDADKNCPIVQGSSLRLAIPYVDPKVADNTDEESRKYDERCRQICREMLFVFSQC